MKNILFLLLLAFHCIFAQNTEIRLSVKIDNRKSDTLYLGKNDFKQAYVADSKGTFTGKFTGPSGKYYLVNGEDYVDIYLDKGFDLTLTADGNDFKKSMLFKGKGAKENSLFARQDANSLATEMDIADGIDDLEAFTKGSEARLKGFRSELKDKSFSPGFREFMEEELGHDENNFPLMSQYQFKRQHLNGKPLPDFTYTNHDGGTTTSHDFRGKYMLIDIWATWCGPCRKEGSYFDGLELKYRDKNIAFVSISIDRMEDFGRWKETVTARQMAGIQLICDKEFDSDLMNQLAVKLCAKVHNR